MQLNSTQKTKVGISKQNKLNKISCQTTKFKITREKTSQMMNQYDDTSEASNTIIESTNDFLEDEEAETVENNLTSSENETTEDDSKTVSPIRTVTPPEVEKIESTDKNATSDSDESETIGDKVKSTIAVDAVSSKTEVLQFNDPNNEIDLTEDLSEEDKTASEEKNPEEKVPEETELAIDSNEEILKLIEEVKTLLPKEGESSTPKKIISNPTCSIKQPETTPEKTVSEEEISKIESKLKKLKNISPISQKEDVTGQKLFEDIDENYIFQLLYKSKSLYLNEKVSNISTTSDHHEIQESTVRRFPSGKEIHKTKIKLKQVDELKILKQAVQLLENRTNMNHFSSSCRGILGILALQNKIKQLIDEKELLETNLEKCIREFSDIIDILTDKSRIISINNREVENFIKILNIRIPEIEKSTKSNTKVLDDIKYRISEKNYAKINELKRNVENYENKIETLKQQIEWTTVDNEKLKNQIDSLDIDNFTYKNQFNKKIVDVKANLMNLQILNNDLQNELENIHNSDLGKNETFQLKLPKLKGEVDTLSNDIKILRQEKNAFEAENIELRKKLKKLVLTKVMDKQN